MLNDHECYWCGETADAVGHIVLPGFEARACWSHADRVLPLAKAIEAHVRERLATQADGEPARTEAAVRAETARCVAVCRMVAEPRLATGYSGSIYSAGARDCADALAATGGA